MASPPFTLNTSAPANSDIAANFPSLDRSDKGIISSWLSVQWNSYGHTTADYYDAVGSTNGLVSAPTASAGTGVIYRDSDTVFKYYDGDATAIFPLGVPVGAIMMWGATSPPNGYLLCDGSAVSRTTYARLFAVIDTTWGSGNGSTTFNVPALNGSGAYLLPNATPNLTGGSNTTTLSAANIPSLSGSCSVSVSGSTSGAQSVTISSGQGSHQHSTSTSFVYNENATTGGTTDFLSNSGEASGSVTSDATLPALSGTATGALSVSASGSGTWSYSGSATAVSTAPQYVTVPLIIKY